MPGQKIAYIRVSSPDQNPERQLDGIQVDRSFIEHVSAKTMDRPQLQAMLQFVREGDQVIVHSIDRIARNVPNLHEIIRTIVKKGATIQFMKENLTFTGQDSPMSILLLNVMGALAEFERTLIYERQMEGIRLARQKGTYKGRLPRFTSQEVEEMRKLREMGIPISRIAKDRKVTYQSIYCYLTRPNKKTRDHL